MPDPAGTIEEGDVFVAVNEVAQPVDLRAGVRGYGRYWHCDRSLNRKAEVRTGEYGLIVGLAFDPRRQIVFATSPRLSRIMAFDALGAAVGLQLPPNRSYGNILSDPAGRLVAGIHTNDTVPAADPWGNGKLVRFDPFAGGCEFFDVEIDGGRGNRHGVSGLAIHPGEQDVVYYVSEAGQRLCRYDMVARRQLPDLLVLNEGEARTYGLGIRASGEVVMATGTGAVHLDPEGRTIRTYDVPAARGWTRASLCADGRHFYLGNFIEGILQRRDIETGEIVAMLDVELKGALTAVAEFTPNA